MRIEIHLFASDDDNGTHAAAFATDREAEDEVLAAIGETRESFDAWVAAGGCKEGDDFWDFYQDQKCEPLDTHNTYSETIDFDLCAQPLPDSDVAKAREAVECLRRARDLLKASNNKQTLKRVEAALSGALGAVRINEGRAVKTAVDSGPPKWRLSWVQLANMQRFAFHQGAAGQDFIGSAAEAKLAELGIDKAAVVTVAYAQHPRDARELWVSTEAAGAFAEFDRVL